MDGRFEYETRRVLAGDSLSERRWPHSLLLGRRDTLVFEADGRLRAARQSGQPRVWMGTWALEANRLRLMAPERGLDVFFEVGGTDDDLRLVGLHPGRDPLDDLDLSDAARFHLEPGTSTDLRTALLMNLER